MKNSILLISNNLDLLRQQSEYLSDNIEDIFIYIFDDEEKVFSFLEQWEPDIIIADKDMVKYSYEDYIELFDDIPYIIQDNSLPINLDKVKELIIEKQTILEKFYKYLLN